jgi:hypothetical protein
MISTEMFKLPIVVLVVVQAIIVGASDGIDPVINCQLSEGEPYAEITVVDVTAEKRNFAVMRQCEGIFDCSSKALCMDGTACGICGWIESSKENRKLKIRFNAATTDYLYLAHGTTEVYLRKEDGLANGAVFAVGYSNTPYRDVLDCLKQTNCSACTQFTSCVWCQK